MVGNVGERGVCRAVVQDRGAQARVALAVGEDFPQGRRRDATGVRGHGCHQGDQVATQ
jgi:hypothetical protein